MFGKKYSPLFIKNLTLKDSTNLFVRFDQMQSSQ